MPRDEGEFTQAKIQGLLDAYRLYDRSVDVVSAYQWLFSDPSSATLPPTVAHFERFPNLAGPDGKKATPDFTILFKDGTGIAAEIANIALHDNSVDKLCRQLDRYSRLDRLPSGPTTTSPVSVCDVLYLSPFDLAPSAAKRVYADRLDAAGHAFKPPRRPVLVAFSQQPDRYTFTFWPFPANGALHKDNGRHPNYGDWDEALNIKPHMFQGVKVTQPFVNDPIPPLYLATRLWASVFPSLAGGRGTVFTAGTRTIADHLRTMYGRCTVDDVESAMGILYAARLTTRDKTGTWHVKRVGLRAADTHQEIADRLLPKLETATIAPQKPRRRPAGTQPLPGQTSLFDDLP
ncbi:hypothetical protein [Propionicicella superfundia]|uniref:hypothetical protein n=1 Tax=Propionicicella superfundia TaxID=348582 RepID=UPI00040C6202|nr:hypothetical protein [Propionicicella superfundia]